jgi:glycerol-3-phosphate acyltransferase PlsY
MRVGGFKLAAATWLLDMLKAIIAVILGIYFVGLGFGAALGLVAIVGHAYPVWLKFKGGKGVSAMFGTLLAINPIVFAGAGLIWLTVALTTKYSSLGAVAVFLVLPIFGFTIGFNVGLAFVGISILNAWLHRENIKRLINGTESKIVWKWKK